ncbi:serine protease filzig-like [Palaemon carinicauda]|uniref:serine protease filzig-like n=1 Tax=Palaemon carinicauda TaxID=392227 RepID=UPI0035B6A724
MGSLVPFLLLCTVIAGVLADSSEEETPRRGRQMFNRITDFKNRESVRLPLCRIDGTTGACMKQAKCVGAGGKYAGFCGLSQDVCCVSDLTCGNSMRSHHAYFRNPAFPNGDTEARPCILTVEVGRGVCGVRMDFDKFELAKFEDGVCIRDTFTILGTKKGPTTPICGNMTNWSTSFAVNERSQLQLAMVVQGHQNYTFSISVTQLACDDVVVFTSPTYAGIRNLDAEDYNPTTKNPFIALLKPPSSTPEPDTEDSLAATTTTEPSDVDQTTELLNEIDGGESNEEDGEDTTQSPGEVVPTTLKIGTIPKPVIREVQIRSSGNYLEDGVYEGTIDSTPAISAFRRAFELKVNDKCFQLTDEYPADPSFRVIGGGYTGVNEYPWQVALVYDKKFFCGGSLISDRHILTAAHCVFGSFSKGLDKLFVSLGDHDLSTRNETEHIVAKVKHIFWHLHYNPHTTENDIALMELEEPVTYSYSVSAVKLPADLDDMFEDANATVTGWGRYSTKLKSTSTVLKEHTGPLTKTDRCLAAWDKFPGISARFPDHVCFDVTMGTPCHGDSGGPLVVCTGVQCTQIGVVSFGFPMCTNVGLPAIFTRVSTYKGWIDMNLTPLDVSHRIY